MQVLTVLLRQAFSPRQKITALGRNNTPKRISLKENRERRFPFRKAPSGMIKGRNNGHEKKASRVDYLLS
jgi:hypothetical protein